MPASNQLTVLDGDRSIGGTKLLVESRGTRVLLDFGTNYLRMGQYYEEFLKPRAPRGLVDPIEMGLLPRRRGLYRADLFPPHDYPDRDRDWGGEAPDALLLTHGHLDHAGGLAYLDPSIPVVATPLTLALLRAWQETGPHDVSAEVTYLGGRTPGGRARGSLPGRLLEGDRTAPKRTRAFRTLGEAPPAFSAALRRSPFSERTEFEAIDPLPAGSRVLDLPFDAAAVDHSVYGATAFLLDADGGRVAYTGDLRFHGEMAEATERFVRRLEAVRPELLVVEGTRLRSKGSDPLPPIVSESEVEANCRREVERWTGRLVVADFGPRNIERLRSFRRIALSTGRALVLTPKDAFLLTMLHAADPRIEVDIAPGAMRILEEPSNAPGSWMRRVEDAYDPAFLTPVDVARSPGRFLLCFSFFDCNDLVDLKREGATSGGLWLFSSSEAHGEEQEFDFRRLQAWIRWAGMSQIGFRYLSGPDGSETLSFSHPDDVGHHASGHATEPELVELIRRANPRRIVPVHTVQSPDRYEELLRARGAEVEVVRPEAGRPILW